MSIWFFFISSISLWRLSFICFKCACNFLLKHCVYLLRYFTHHKIHPFEVYDSVVFSIFTKLCNHYHYLMLKHLYQNTKPHTHHQSLLISLSPQVLETINLCSVFIDLPILDNSCLSGIIQHVTFCVWLLLLSIMFSKFIYVIVSMSTSFFIAE